MPPGFKTYTILASNCAKLALFLKQLTAGK